jgi:hypothetical protein
MVGPEQSVSMDLQMMSYLNSGLQQQLMVSYQMSQIQQQHGIPNNSHLMSSLITQRPAVNLDCTNSGVVGNYIYIFIIESGILVSYYF